MAQSIIEITEQRGIEQGMARGIEQGMARGIEQGMARGIEQGIAQGARETTVKNILTILTKRFPESDTHIAAQALETLLSLERLEQLLDTALLAPTFNDFLQALET